MDGFESSQKLGGLFPYFFYDVIARIMPGAFLILGAMLTWKGEAFLCLVGTSVLASGNRAGYGSTVGVTWVQFLIGLLVFLGTSSFLGVIMASLSHSVVEKPLWQKRKPLSLEGLKKYLGARDLSKLQELYRTQFGYPIGGDSEEINRQSVMCSYYVWTVDQRLGIFTVRHDAEALGSQSALFASALLIFFSGLRMISSCTFNGFYAIWFVLLAAFLIGLGLTYNYHREKRVYCRYALYFAVSQPVRQGKNEQLGSGDTPDDE